MEPIFLVPVITPFNKDETVNYDALQRHTAALIKRGATGIYAGGSSAECFSLTEDERKKTLAAVKEAAGNTFVAAHIGSACTVNSIRLARHAQTLGCQAISSVPPFYFRYSFSEIKSYYTDIVDSVELPMMIYNIPANTGAVISPEEMLELMSNEKIKYLKYTDTNFYALEQIVSHSRKTVYSGKDEEFLSALSVGVYGAIGTTFNFMLYKYIQIYNLFHAGDMEAALKIQHSANEVIRTVCACGLIESTKYMIQLVSGVDCGYARKPFAQLDDGKKRLLEAIAEAEGLLTPDPKIDQIVRLDRRKVI